MLPSIRLGPQRRRSAARTTRCCFAGARLDVRRLASRSGFHLPGLRARRVERGQSRCGIRRPRRGHVRAAARCRRPPSLTRHAAGVPRRPAAAQQGDPLPRGPANDRGDRRRHAPRRRRRPRPTAARPDRGSVARRPADPRGARARRGRPGRAPRIAAGAARQGRPPPRGRHGRLGVGAACPVAEDAGGAAGRPAVLRRQRPTRGRPWSAGAARSELRASPARPACGGGSRRTSCATRTRSRWPAKACR